MTPQPPPLPSRRIAVWLSVAYPGAGQFYQRRWLAGSLYSMAVTLLAILLIYKVAAPMVHNLNAILQWSPTQMDAPLETISIKAVLIDFAILLIVYAVNIADVMRGNRARTPPQN